MRGVQNIIDQNHISNNHRRRIEVTSTMAYQLRIQLKNLEVNLKQQKKNL